MKKIDLNNLNEDQLELLQRTSKKLIVDYKNLIKNIYSDSDKSIDWKLNSLLSRDNYLSNVFKDICYVFFIKKSLSIGNIDLIICNNYPQKAVLQKYIDSNSLKVKVITHETLLQRIKV